MTSISPLENVLKKGLYGDHEGKSEDKLTKVKEIKNLDINTLTPIDALNKLHDLINKFHVNESHAINCIGD